MGSGRTSARARRSEAGPLPTVLLIATCLLASFVALLWLPLYLDRATTPSFYWYQFLPVLVMLALLAAGYLMLGRSDDR